MAHRNVYQKLGFRISEEVQLLSEEKWIVEALAQIKNQRNCLQIERLHLESLKSKLKMNQGKNLPETNLQTKEDDAASKSAVHIMQNVCSTAKANENEMEINEEFCNDEELNLMVSTPAFMKSSSNDDFNMEEYEEESDDDMFIDMNMLMNGTAKSQRRK